MPQYIILTKAEADAIRGKSSPFAAIEPVLLKDGTYVIGDEVLADPAHAALVAKVVGIKGRIRSEKSAIDALTISPEITEIPVLDEEMKLK